MYKVIQKGQEDCCYIENFENIGILWSNKCPSPLCWSIS